MIIQTTKEINGVVYDYTYSDSGFMIEQDGVRYSEAVDPIDSNRVYTETNEPIERGTDEATAEDYREALKEFGVDKVQELVETLSAENVTLVDDMAQMVEEVYQSDMEMMGI